MKTTTEIEYEITLKTSIEDITRYAWSLEKAHQYLRAFAILMETSGPDVENLPRVELRAYLVEKIVRDGETIHVPA